jgi:hypothetical protein
MTDPSPPRVEIIRRANKLKAKVGGSADGKGGRIDPGALTRAGTHVARLAEAHQTQTRIDLADLLAAVQAAQDEPERRQAHLQRIYELADGVMSVGQMFGYSLLSNFGNSLACFVTEMDAANPAHMMVVRLHAESMQAVVRDNIKGEGGEIGKQLAQSLNAARKKLAPQVGDEG